MSALVPARKPKETDFLGSGGASSICDDSPGSLQNYLLVVDIDRGVDAPGK
jgi:hypothetical protein